MQFGTHGICNMGNLQHVQDKSVRWIRYMDQLDGSAGHTSWTDQLDEPAGRTSWEDQQEGPAGRNSSLYLKPWPVRIFGD